MNTATDYMRMSFWVSQGASGEKMKGGEICRGTKWQESSAWWDWDQKQGRQVGQCLDKVYTEKVNWNLLVELNWSFLPILSEVAGDTCSAHRQLRSISWWGREEILFCHNTHPLDQWSPGTSFVESDFSTDRAEGKRRTAQPRSLTYSLQ